MATEPRYYIFYKRNSFTSSAILFWYVLTTKTKTTNGKISTLKMIFFHFRLYIKIFEIFSFLLIPNMSYVKEIWILLLVSHFHGIALNPNLVEEATSFMIWFKLNYKAICHIPLIKWACCLLFTTAMSSLIKNYRFVQWICSPCLKRTLKISYSIH